MLPSGGTIGQETSLVAEDKEHSADLVMRSEKGYRIIKNMQSIWKEKIEF